MGGEVNHPYILVEATRIPLSTIFCITPSPCDSTHHPHYLTPIFEDGHETSYKVCTICGLVTR